MTVEFKQAAVLGAIIEVFCARHAGLQNLNINVSEKWKVWNLAVIRKATIIVMKYV